MDRREGKEAPALFACKECGLHYEDEATAQRCAAWCRAHKSCNPVIIKSAIENRPRPH